MDHLIQFIYGFFASVAFAVIFYTPKRALFYSGVIGGIGWIVYRYLLGTINQVLAAALIAAILIGTLSAVFAIIIKIPTLILYIPSLIPLVPGGGMYYTMYYLIQQDMDLFGAKALETSLIAIALATGIFLSTSIINMLAQIFHIKKGR
ncbi:MAG: threonine/serine exporter [Tissierellia bacterium]|nr:threonine/serine exporter [Tissierellia bacterium]